MRTWQSIMSEQFYDSDFKLSGDNDDFIVDGIINSYENDAISDLIDKEELKILLNNFYKNGYDVRLIKSNYRITRQYKDGFIAFNLTDKPFIYECRAYIDNRLLVKFPNFYKHNLNMELDNKEFLEISYDLLCDENYPKNIYEFFTQVYDKVVK